MERFHLIDDAAVILSSRGVFRQVKVFRRGDGVYAAHGAGFIRLYTGRGTSIPAISWDDIEGVGATRVGTHGRLLLAQAAP